MTATKIFLLDNAEWGIIKCIAEGRMTANDRTRRKVCDLGSREKNLAADRAGAAGEYGVEQFLHIACPEFKQPNSGWAMRLTPKVMKRSVKEADVAIYSRTLGRFIADTKASATAFCSINEQQRTERPAPFYIPVKILLDRGIEVFEPVPSAAVAKWSLRDGHSPYRSIAFSDLHPMTPIEFRAWLEKNLTPVDRIPRISVD